jgi:hypothetical protein
MPSQRPKQHRKKGLISAASYPLPSSAGRLHALGVSCRIPKLQPSTKLCPFFESPALSSERSHLPPPCVPRPGIGGTSFSASLYRVGSHQYTRKASPGLLEVLVYLRSVPLFANAHCRKSRPVPLCCNEGQTPWSHIKPAVAYGDGYVCTSIHYFRSRNTRSIDQNTAVLSVCTIIARTVLV